MSIFTLQWQNGIVATETLWPAKPKMFTIWPFKESLSIPLLILFLLIKACIVSNSNIQVVLVYGHGGGVTGVWATLRCHF